MGLYAFFAKRLPPDRKFYDRIPPLAEKKYLKTVYECLERCTPLLKDVPQGAKRADVLKFDEALRRLAGCKPY
jgi:hypothetical protein